MTYNSANRKDVRRLEKQSKLDERARQDTVRALMGTMNGRQWVYDRLAGAHIFASSFSLSHLEMAFREGERNSGLQLLNDVMACAPDEYVHMMREANERHHSHDNAAAGEHARGEDSEWGDQADPGSASYDAPGDDETIN